MAVEQDVRVLEARITRLEAAVQKLDRAVRVLIALERRRRGEPLPDLAKL